MNSIAIGKFDALVEFFGARLLKGIGPAETKGMTKLLCTLALLFFTACNFYEVDPGNLYRSAQLSGPEFEKVINDVGIKTVINLRGAAPGYHWYDEEIKTMEKLNINHIDIGMSANRLPHRDDLIKLLDAFKDAPRPILIHCQAGADRTGEAAAIYQMIYMGKSKEEAMKMLNPKYHHFEAFTPAKDYFIKEVWQNEDWAYNEYDPCTGEYKFYNTNVDACKELQ